MAVADIFRDLGPRYRQQHRLAVHHKLTRAIEQCRTASLSGHVEQCGHCAHRRISYNSCRNRHVPSVRVWHGRSGWSGARPNCCLWSTSTTSCFKPAPPLCTPPLPIPDTSAHRLASSPFSLPGGKNLTFHPHIHYVVTGGGLSPASDRWIFTNPGFLLSARSEPAFSQPAARSFAAGLYAKQSAATDSLRVWESHESFPRWLRILRRKEWVVHTKPPFGGPQYLLEYLGRYTNRVAISNRRLTAFNGGAVTFLYKDYRRHGPSRNEP